jgi:spore coat polysaccharide biosynthesis protein SpsF (cytidylyltransferase family)
MRTLGKVTILEEILRRIQSALFGYPLVVVTTSDHEDQPIVAWCAERGVACHAGDLNDPLAAMIQVAQQQEARVVLRCLDSAPLLNPRMLDACARYALDSSLDYVQVGRLPQGVAMEAMLLRTLTRTAALTQDPRHRTQVSSFALEHPEMFERAFLPPPPRMARPELRFCLETEADYERMARLFREVPACMNGLIRLEDAIAWADSGRNARSLSPAA